MQFLQNASFLRSFEMNPFQFGVLGFWGCTYLNYSVQIIDISCTLLSLVFLTFFTIFLEYHILLLLAFPFQILILHYLKEYRVDRLKEFLYPTIEISHSEIKELTYIVTNMVSGSKNKANLNNLACLIINHSRYCRSLYCKCREVEFKDDESIGSIMASSDIKAMKGNIIKEDFITANYSKMETQIYEILAMNISLFKNLDTVAEIEILKAYLHHYKMGRSFTGLYNLMIAEESGFSIFQDYQIFCIRKTIEIAILEDEKRNTSSLKVDFDNMVSFHQKYMELNDMILDATQDFSHYWCQYLKITPELNEIVEIGFSISQKCERIEETLEILSVLDPNNIKGLVVFALFQKNVMEDDFGAYETFLRIKREEDSQHLNRKYLGEAESLVSASSTAVVVVSGNRFNLGTIINTNNELDQILGYSKEELVGENVSVLMPEIIARYHNLFILNYFERSTSDTSSHTKDSIVYGQHLLGFIVPCHLIVRLVPNLQNGVQFIGFIKRAIEYEDLSFGEKVGYFDDMIILLLDNEYRIYGMNQTATFLCTENEGDLQIQKYHKNQQKLFLRNILPEIFEDETSLFSETAIQLPINILNLKIALSEEILDTYLEEEEKGIPQISSPSLHSFQNASWIKMINYKYDISDVSYKICLIYPENSKFSNNTNKINLNLIEENVDNTKKYEAAMEDPEGTASVTTSSNFSQSAMEIRFAKEMKYGMKNKQVSRSVRTLQILAIVVGIILTIMSTIMFVIHNNNLNEVLEILEMVECTFERYNSLIEIPANIRILNNIATKRINIQSSISAISDRCTYYLQRLSEVSDQVRECENGMLANSFAETFSSYLYKKIKVYELDENAWSNETDKVSSRTMDIHSAISTILGKLTIFNGATYDAIVSIQNSVEQASVYERAFFFAYNNSNGNIREVSESLCSAIKNYCLSFFDDKEFILQILNWILLALSIVTSVVLLPFIYYAQKNIMNIVKLFMDIGKTDIKFRLQKYRDLTQQITTNYNHIQSYYYNTDFSTNIMNLKEGQVEEVPNEEQNDASGKLEKKAKLKEIKNRSNTNFFFISLKMLILMLFFVGYFILQYVIADNFFHKAAFTIEFYILLHYRLPALTCMSSFMTETVIAGYPITDSNGDILFVRYYNRSLEVEEDIANLRIRMKQHYPEILPTFAILETHNSCKFASTTETSLDIKGCQNDLQGWANEGISQLIGIYHMHALRIFENFSFNDARSTESVKQDVFNNSYLQDLLDLMEAYFGPISEVYKFAISSSTSKDRL